MSRSVRGDGVEHPLPFAAVLVLALNDHVLKGAGVAPAWLTGKLSDFAGLFFFPILLVSIARLLTLRISKQTSWLVGLGTACAFALIKLVAPINALVGRAWGPMSMDATDLVALPMCALSALWMMRTTGAPTASAPPRSWGRFLPLAAASLATVATPAMHYPPCRERPQPLPRITWEHTCLEPPVLAVKLSRGAAHVSMPLRPRKGPCQQPMASFALEWQPTPDVLARADAHMKEAKLPPMIEQATMFEADLDLPYPAHCTGMRTYVTARPDDRGPYGSKYPFAILETPIASCTEEP